MIIADSTIEGLMEDHEILVVPIGDLWQPGDWYTPFEAMCNRHNLEFFPKKPYEKEVGDKYYDQCVYIFHKSRKIVKVIDALLHPSENGARILNEIDWRDYQSIKHLL